MCIKPEIEKKSFPESESFSIFSLCFIDVIWEFYDPSKQNKPTIPSVRDVVSSRRKFMVLDLIILLTMGGMIARKIANVNKRVASERASVEKINRIPFHSLKMCRYRRRRCIYPFHRRHPGCRPHPRPPGSHCRSDRKGNLRKMFRLQGRSTLNRLRTWRCIPS